MKRPVTFDPEWWAVNATLAAISFAFTYFAYFN